MTQVVEMDATPPSTWIADYPPDLERIVLNALLWIAKADVPARGVVDNITAADLPTNLDPKTK